MPHFFIKSQQIDNNKVIISKDENFFHLKNSLRSKAGEKLLLIDENFIQYETIIDEIDKEKIIAKIETSYKSERFIKNNIYLAQAVLKTEAQNYVIQKASELGIKGIYPLVTDNCVIKYDVASKKIQHWQRISYEASKQCERPDVAVVNEIKDFNFIINNSEFDYVFVFAERNANTSLKNIIANEKIKASDKILLVTGPEGGFSKDEFEKMDKYNLRKLTLGKLILRADTAVISAISTVLYELQQ